MNQPLYQLKAVQQRYGDLLALDIDEFLIHQGTILGLAGPNGSGKSSLLRLLAFIDTPACGEMRYNGTRVHASGHSVRLEATLLSQENYLLRRSVRENVLYGLKVRKDWTDHERRLAEALNWVGLPVQSFAHRQWYELSGGEAQRVALAARLILKPRVLLMDEPTANVDAASSLLIKNASLMARAKWGTTLVIAAHDQSWLRETCDETLHLFQGRLIGCGEVNFLFGPWRRRADGFSEQLLSCGVTLVASSPPRDDAVGVLDPAQLSISPSSFPKTCYQHSLDGIVIALVLRNGGREIMATVAVGSLELRCRLTRLEMIERGIHLGQKVRVSYSPENIRWV